MEKRAPSRKHSPTCGRLGEGSAGRYRGHAEVQLAAIRASWLANRPAALDLFDREFDAAVITIGKAMILRAYIERR